jgi:hypothetical protein
VLPERTPFFANYNAKFPKLLGKQLSLDNQQYPIHCFALLLPEPSAGLVLTSNT